MVEEWILDRLSDATNIPVDDLRQLIEKGTIRFMEYKGVPYFSFRKRARGIEEGATVLVSCDEDPLVVAGYPHIARIALPSIALPRHFIDKVVVEEKMDGYNVRVVFYAGKLFAITRGGLVCPYTTQRIGLLYGNEIREFYREYDPYKYFLAGEVVGKENPYVRKEYPEAPRFGYFIFDVFREIKPAPLALRDEVVEKYKLNSVRVMGVIDKDDLNSFWRFLEQLDKEGREGVVLKDPEYRVEPLKYTTNAADISDIAHGMLFFEDEGRDYLYTRSLRLGFRLYERPLGDLEKLYRELGRAILEPIVEAIRRGERWEAGYEEFTLPFTSYTDAQEFVEFMERLGLELVVVDIIESDNEIRLIVRKPKLETEKLLARVLKTGLFGYD